VEHAGLFSSEERRHTENRSTLEHHARVKKKKKKKNNKIHSIEGEDEVSSPLRGGRKPCIVHVLPNCDLKGGGTDPRSGGSYIGEGPQP